MVEILCTAASKTTQLRFSAFNLVDIILLLEERKNPAIAGLFRLKSLRCRIGRVGQPSLLSSVDAPYSVSYQ